MSSRKLVALPRGLLPRGLSGPDLSSSYCTQSDPIHSIPVPTIARCYTPLFYSHTQSQSHSHSLSLSLTLPTPPSRRSSGLQCSAGRYSPQRSNFVNLIQYYTQTPSCHPTLSCPGRLTAHHRCKRIHIPIDSPSTMHVVEPGSEDSSGRASNGVVRTTATGTPTPAPAPAPAPSGVPRQRRNAPAALDSAQASTYNTNASSSLNGETDNDNATAIEAPAGALSSMDSQDKVKRGGHDEHDRGRGAAGGGAQRQHPSVSASLANKGEAIDFDLQNQYGTPWSERSVWYQFMPFRGMFYDVRGRLPFYPSDWTTAFKPKNFYRVAAASIRMYFIKWVAVVG